MNIYELWIVILKLCSRINIIMNTNSSCQIVSQCSGCMRSCKERNTIWFMSIVHKLFGWDVKKSVFELSFILYYIIYMYIYYIIYIIYIYIASCVINASYEMRVAAYVIFILRRMLRLCQSRINSGFCVKFFLANRRHRFW